MSVSLDESSPGITRVRWSPLIARAGSAVTALRAPSASTHSIRRAAILPERAAASRDVRSVAGRWWSPLMVLACGLAASALNATALGFGQRPDWRGMVASVAFLASWVGYLAATRPDRRPVALRRLNVCWAAIIAGSALTASVVGLHLSPLGGQLIEGALAVCSLLLAAPLYGLTGLIGGEQFPLGMAGLAVACYLGLLAVAVAGLRSFWHHPAA